MKPRITINLRPDGELEIWLNPEGRAAFVEALQALNEGDEHLHMGTPDEYFELELSPRPYRQDDQIIERGKVLYRTDEWDRQYYPDVFGPDSDE